MDEQTELQQQLQERFKQLPPAVQKAITSNDLETQLQTLAKTHQLHIDQWATLENEIMLAMLGFQPMQSLAGNIARELSLPQEQADAIAADVSKTIFAPIRHDLEQILSGEEAAEPSVEIAAPAPESSAPAAAQNPTPQAPSMPTPPSTPIAPATPPAPAPTQKVERAPANTNYAATQPSHERKSIEGDPYREQVA